MTPLRQRLIEELALRGYSDKTRDAYVHAVACLARHYNRTPDTLSDEELRAYLLQLHEKGDKARSTLNVAVSGLRFFYQRVLNRPFSHLERNLPRPRQAKRKPKAYTLAEVKRLLERGCPNPKHRAFLMTVYGAGLRLNEACRLRPEHLDRSAGQIRVEQGKGRKDRHVMLSPEILVLLREWWTIRANKYDLGVPVAERWLFPGRRKGLHLTPRQVSRLFQEAIARAGIKKKVTLHALRHSFATHLFDRGTDIRTIQALLGHEKLETTARYTRVATGLITAVESPLDQLDMPHSAKAGGKRRRGKAKPMPDDGTDA